MEKRPVGRPPIPEHKKAKPISKMIRAHLDVADLLKEIADMYKAGLISIEDIRALSKSGARCN